MSDQKISELTPVVTPASTDAFAVNQGGVSKQETITQIIGGTTQGAIPFVGSAATLVQDSSNFFYNSLLERMGIGTNSPEGGIHISTGVPSVVGPSSQANTAIFQSDSDAGITIFSPDANTTSVVFGSPGGIGNEGARIRWSKTNELLSIVTTESNADIIIAPGFLQESIRFKSNGQIGIGTSTPETSSILELSSTNNGFLVPRMTTILRNLISSPATGLQIYNTTTNKINFYNGTEWRAVADVAG